MVSWPSIVAGTSDPGDTVDGWQTEQAEACIQTVWLQAAAPWCRAVRDGRIRSRVAVTNAAILDAIAARPGGRLLDLGCGEGWLLRARQSGLARTHRRGCLP